jgi:hypothetical protein
MKAKNKSMNLVKTIQLHSIVATLAFDVKIAPRPLKKHFSPALGLAAHLFF